MTANPLLTFSVFDRLQAARRAAAPRLECSLDLSRSSTSVEIEAERWIWQGRAYPYPTEIKKRTIYYWNRDRFAPIARFSTALVKLVETDWGPPTFEIDGIKMLPTARVSPYEDARRKVATIDPRDRVVLDTCGGLGYFAAWCLDERAQHVASFEKSPDVMWLRSLNPWSPAAHPKLSLMEADVTRAICALGEQTFDAVLHDPPRFAIAGELYARDFYAQLARVIQRRGKLFHYTGAPNGKSRGRNLGAEVAQRLRTVGFTVEPSGDGVLASKR